MTIGFPSRAAVCCSAACVVGALAFAPKAGRRPRRSRPGHSPRLRVETRHRAALGTGPARDPGTAPGRGAQGAAGRLRAVVAGGRRRHRRGTRAHNAHLKLPPASTLKTLFALTVLPVLPAAVRHTVTEEELAGVGDGSSRVGVAAGRTYRAADLWRGVFLNSGNDAVHVLAEMNGGWRSTAAQMQAKARSLGARDTRVVSPDGYDTPGQVSSAYDLAVFGRAGLRNADFARYASHRPREVPGRRLVVRDPEHQPAAHRRRRGRALPGARRRQERLHLPGGQHARRRRAPGRAHPRRHGDGPSGGRLRRVRGGALAARLGLRGRRAGRTGGLAAAAAPRVRGRIRRRCPRPWRPTAARPTAGWRRRGRSRAPPGWARVPCRWCCASVAGGSPGPDRRAARGAGRG
jgi:hypothetical protein